MLDTVRFSESDAPRPRSAMSADALPDRVETFCRSSRVADFHRGQPVGDFSWGGSVPKPLFSGRVRVTGVGPELWSDMTDTSWCFGLVEI
jgi:hypothetical protein